MNFGNGKAQRKPHEMSLIVSGVVDNVYRKQHSGLVNGEIVRYSNFRHWWEHAMVQIAPGLNSTTGTPVAGLNDVASGAEHWTINVPAGDAIAAFDPSQEGLVPTIDIVIDLKANAPAEITFTGSVGATAPADSIGFTGLINLQVINDTGTALNGLTLSLADVAQQMPLTLAPDVIQFGDKVGANYAFITQVQPGSFDGLTQTLSSPANQPTNAMGPAASTLTLAGAIPVCGKALGSFVVHNTETGAGNNDFVMNVIPT